MNIEERRIVVEPIEVLEDVPLDESNLEKFTRIETSIERKMKQDLIQFLKKSIVVFAWSQEDMPRIDPSVINHRLNVSSSYKLVRQKRRVFAPRMRQCLQRISLKVGKGRVHPQTLLP